MNEWDARKTDRPDRFVKVTQKQFYKIILLAKVIPMIRYSKEKIILKRFSAFLTEKNDHENEKFKFSTILQLTSMKKLFNQDLSVPKIGLG